MQVMARLHACWPRLKPGHSQALMQALPQLSEGPALPCGPPDVRRTKAISTRQAGQQITSVSFNCSNGSSVSSRLVEVLLTLPPLSQCRLRPARVLLSQKLAKAHLEQIVHAPLTPFSPDNRSAWRALLQMRTLCESCGISAIKRMLAATRRSPSFVHVPSLQRSQYPTQFAKSP